MNAPKRFRKRPVEIEAMQWDGHPGTAMMVCVWINSRFGAATFSAGRIYPCKPDIFAATYNEVTE